MDPRIQEYLEGLVSKDEPTGRGRGWSTQMYTPMNQASQSEDVGGNHMSEAVKHLLGIGKVRYAVTQMPSPMNQQALMNQASQSEDVGGNHMSEAVKHLLGIGKVRYAVTQMPSPMNQQALMNQASQSEDVSGNHKSEAVKHVLRIGNACYAVTQMHSPMDQQTEAEVNRLLYSIFMLEQSYVKARNKHANFEEVQSKLDELYKLENYLKNIKGADPQGLYEVKNRLKKILEHAKKISEADEKSNVSARIYTPMQQASQAEGVDWNRMTQIAQRASESDNLRINPGGSMWRYMEDDTRQFPSEQEEITSPNRRHNSPSSPPMRSESRRGSWSTNSRNSYPDAEALMNAVLNYEQNPGELNASSPHHQGRPQNPQTEERRNARRRSRPSHQDATRQAQAYMQSPMVQSVLNTGVDPDRVRNVIEKRIRDTGNAYPNAEDLMNAVLNYRQNRGGLNAPSPQDQIQGYPEICQERSNTRRRSRPSTSSHQEETRNVHAQMQSPMVQTILNTGVDRDRVRNVIERRIRDTGNAFPNSDALMNAVLNFGQTREVLNTQYSNDQNPHVIPQNASRSQPPSTGGRTSSSQNQDLEQVVSELRQKTKCKVCLDFELEVMFQPCNHLCCCRSCGERVETCPVCRSPIESRVRTLIP
ncbi:uncharacterized protein [Magallana gigas]|uniref:uncharacterized protein isoform X2 n=1 Tax=Magallana gigas TaxID=29159 RepID=UPI0033409012